MKFKAKKEFQIKELMIYRTRKINLGNYESEDIHLGLKVDIPSHDQLEPAYQYVAKYLEQRIQFEETKIRAKGRGD